MTGELQNSTASTQTVITCVNNQGSYIINCVTHLACYCSIPNKSVEFQLVFSKITSNFIGSTQYAGRTNRFVSVLCILLTAVEVRFCRAVFFTKGVNDVVTNIIASRICKTHGVSTHIGNKTNGRFTQGNTFIKLLGNHHSLFSSEV